MANKVIKPSIVIIGAGLEGLMRYPIKNKRVQGPDIWPTHLTNQD